MGSTEEALPLKTAVVEDSALDERHIRRGLQRGGFYPVFQPIVRFPTHSIAGFEVLARWNDAELGAVPPTRFVPVAEQAGLIPELTSQIIRSACTVAAEWKYQFRLAFNISPLQFQDARLPAQIEAAARPSRFPLSRIQLEITESAVIDDLSAARAAINRLKNLGAQVVLDDFGTGFSSLTRLQALPFDKIKIDRSFVSSMAASRESRKIVSAIIGLGQSLGMPVVAEGYSESVLRRRFVVATCPVRSVDDRRPRARSYRASRSGAWARSPSVEAGTSNQSWGICDGTRKSCAGTTISAASFTRCMLAT